MTQGYVLGAKFKQEELEFCFLKLKHGRNLGWKFNQSGGPFRVVSEAGKPKFEFPYLNPNDRPMLTYIPFKDSPVADYTQARPVNLFPSSDYSTSLARDWV
jgi:hypothetical protein